MPVEIPSARVLVEVGVKSKDFLKGFDKLETSINRLVTSIDKLSTRIGGVVDKTTKLTKPAEKAVKTLGGKGIKDATKGMETLGRTISDDTDLAIRDLIASNEQLAPVFNKLTELGVEGTDMLDQLTLANVHLTEKMKAVKTKGLESAVAMDKAKTATKGMLPEVKSLTKEIAASNVQLNRQIRNVGMEDVSTGIVDASKSIDKLIKSHSVLVPIAEKLRKKGMEEQTTFEQLIRTNVIYDSTLKAIAKDSVKTPEFMKKTKIAISALLPEARKLAKEGIAQITASSIELSSTFENIKKLGADEATTFEMMQDALEQYNQTIKAGTTVGKEQADALIGAKEAGAKLPPQIKKQVDLTAKSNVQLRRQIRFVGIDIFIFGFLFSKIEQGFRSITQAISQASSEMEDRTLDIADAWFDLQEKIGDTSGILKGTLDLQIGFIDKLEDLVDAFPFLSELIGLFLVFGQTISTGIVQIALLAETLILLRLTVGSLNAQMAAQIPLLGGVMRMFNALTAPIRGLVKLITKLSNIVSVKHNRAIARAEIATGKFDDANLKASETITTQGGIVGRISKGYGVFMTQHPKLQKLLKGTGRGMTTLSKGIVGLGAAIATTIGAFLLFTLVGSAMSLIMSGLAATQEEMAGVTEDLADAMEIDLVGAWDAFVDDPNLTTFETFLRRQAQITIVAFRIALESMANAFIELDLGMKVALGSLIAVGAAIAIIAGGPAGMAAGLVLAGIAGTAFGFAISDIVTKINEIEEEPPLIKALRGLGSESDITFQKIVDLISKINTLIDMIVNPFNILVTTPDLSVKIEALFKGITIPPELQTIWDILTGKTPPEKIFVKFLANLLPDPLPEPLKTISDLVTGKTTPQQVFANFLASLSPSPLPELLKTIVDLITGKTAPETIFAKFIASLVPDPLPELFKTILDLITGKITPKDIVAKIVGEPIVPTLGLETALQGLIDWLGSIFTPKATDPFKKMGEAMDNLHRGSPISDLIKAITKIATDGFDKLGPSVDAFKTKVSGLVDALAGVAVGGTFARAGRTGGLISEIVSAIQKMVDKFGEAVSKIQSIATEIRNLPTEKTITIHVHRHEHAVEDSMQFGGLVPTTGLFLLHKGELVVPSATITNLPTFTTPTSLLGGGGLGLLQGLTSPALTTTLASTVGRAIEGVTSQIASSILAPIRSALMEFSPSAFTKSLAQTLAAPKVELETKAPRKPLTFEERVETQQPIDISIELEGRTLAEIAAVYQARKTKRRTIAT